MSSQTIAFIFFGIFIGFWIFILILDKKYAMLRDPGSAQPRSFSWSRVQLTWWMVIVLAAFITAIIRTGGNIPTLNNSTLYILGISSATTMSSVLIDISDQSNPTLTNLGQNMKGVNMIVDILSDKNGINIHRFQNFIFNVIFGVWFMYECFQHLSVAPDCKVCTNPADVKACIDCMTAYGNSIMPDITTNNLVLLGGSSAVYAALKTTENKQGSAIPTPSNTNVSPSQNQPPTLG